MLILLWEQPSLSQGGNIQFFCQQLTSLAYSNISTLAKQLITIIYTCMEQESLLNYLMKYLLKKKHYQLSETGGGTNELNLKQIEFKALAKYFLRTAS